MHQMEAIKAAATEATCCSPQIYEPEISRRPKAKGKNSWSFGRLGGSFGGQTQNQGCLLSGEGAKTEEDLQPKSAYHGEDEQGKH